MPTCARSSGRCSHGSDDELVERFTGRLQFGTAGLRAAVGAGPQRMNRLVVQQAAAGLVDYLLATVPDVAERGVIIGYDTRRKSDVFALDTARVCAAARREGVAVRPRSCPRPVLAWNITAVGAAAGVMVTASHNPPADNGYKVYLGTGSQIVPPADSDIAACIDQVDPSAVELAPADHPLIQYLGAAEIEAYLAVRARGAAAPRRARRAGRRTPRCTGSAAPPCSPRSNAPACPHRPSWPSSSSPTARSRRCRSPTRRSRARWTC